MPFPKHQERYSKISVILNAWHLAQLENLAREIAEWYGVKVSRSEIIRAIVEMAMAKEEEAEARLFVDITPE